MLSRRSFLAGLIASPAIVKIESLMPVKMFPNIIGEVDYGFTLGPTASFDEIIRTTLQKYRSTISDNLSKNNVFLARINNNDYIRVHKISPELQQARIAAKLHDKAMAKPRKYTRSGRIPVKQEELWVAKQETQEEFERRLVLYEENKDKWHNKFAWHTGYDLEQKLGVKSQV